MSDFFKKWLRPLRPQDHWRLEIMLMRFLFALVIFDVLPSRLPPDPLRHPVGLAGMGLDLSWLGTGQTMPILFYLSLAMLTLYVSGYLAWLTTGWLAVVTILVGTYENSSGGDIRHHAQIVSLILLAQWIWQLWATLRDGDGKNALWRERWSVFVSQQVIAAVYVTTGLAKVNKSGFLGWISASENFPLQLRKSNQQSFYNTLEKSHGWGATIEQYFISHPTISQLSLAGGLVLELAAVILLWGRRPAFFIGVLLVIFHTLNAVVMKLNFGLHTAVVSIYLILPAVWHFIAPRLKRFRHDELAPHHPPR
jgi:hypothetical protein